MMNNKDLVVLAIYGYILFFVLKKGQTTEMILLTVGAYFLITSSALDNTFGTLGSIFGKTPTGIEGLSASATVDTSTKDITTQLDSNIQTNSVGSSSNQMIDTLNMGPYDGMCLQTGNKDKWMKSPDDSSLISNDQLFSYLGSQGPLKMRLSDQAALTGPPIDGVEGSPNKYFMFANNITSPACCPSTFSTSTGCVCTTQNQRDFIAARGILGQESKNNNNSEF